VEQSVEVGDLVVLDLDLTILQYSGLKEYCCLYFIVCITPYDDCITGIPGKLQPHVCC